MNYLTQAGLEFLLEDRKQRKAARKVSQQFHSRRRSIKRGDATPFLLKVHRALSTGVGPIDKETGKIQDLSQWKGHATEPGKQSTGTIDVIGNPAHRAAALQSGRESQHCVGTACKELVGEFAHETTKDLSKTAANRQSAQLHRGAEQTGGATAEYLRQRRPNQPRGTNEDQESLDATRDKFRDSLRGLGDSRRQRNVTRARKKIPQNLTGKALAAYIRQKDIKGLGFRGPMGRG